MNFRGGFLRLYVFLWTIWAMAVIGPNVSRIQYVSRDQYQERARMESADTSRGIRMDLPPRPGWHTNITFLDVLWILALAFVFPGALYVVGRWVLRGFRAPA